MKYVKRADEAAAFGSTIPGVKKSQIVVKADGIMTKRRGMRSLSQFLASNFSPSAVCFVFRNSNGGLTVDFDDEKLEDNLEAKALRRTATETFYATLQERIIPTGR